MSGSNGHQNGKPEKQEKKRGRHPPVEYQFKPGQSGNPGGRPKGSRSITAIIQRMLDAGDDTNNIAEKLAKCGLLSAESDFRYWKEIVERIDGKVADKQETDGKLEIVVRYVDKPVTHVTDRD